MSRPRVLMLDEPTSGLDSFAAAVVMGHLASLAAAERSSGRGGGRGMTVVASLHQPRAAIWELVDQVGCGAERFRSRLRFCAGQAKACIGSPGAGPQGQGADGVKVRQHSALEAMTTTTTTTTTTRVCLRWCERCVRCV